MRIMDLQIDPAKLKRARGEREALSVAEMCGITKQRLWNYENGYSDPPSRVLLMLCLIYKTNIDALADANEKTLEKLRNCT